jgi:hypothetical protein
MVFAIIYLATTAAACRRMLSDSVRAVDAEAPRLLEEREMHFTAGDWGSNGVLLLEAEGSPCASGTGGEAGEGGFSASWDTPERGCYRVDAHSAGADCGFGSEVTLALDWCAGRTDTVQYTQTAGWTALGVYPFYPGHIGGITQAQGAVDAFRVVALPDCRARDPPVFGSLTLDTDAEEMPADLASQLAEQVLEFGDVLSASFRPYFEQTRRLSASGLSHVIVDFDLSKLESASMPDKAQISEAAQKVCSLLQTTECATDVSFKLDSSSEVTRVTTKAKGREPKDKASGPVMVMPMVAFASVCLCVVLASKLRKSRAASKEEHTDVAAEKGKPVFEDDAVDWDTAGEQFWDADEKKPQQEDDNVSTATPVSLPDSLPSLDQNAADRV